MGTLAGHILPGSFFIGFAIWWSFITAIRFVQSKPRRSRAGSTDRPVPYRTTSAMPCICMPCGGLRRAPLESWIKILLALLGIMAEFVTGIHFNFVRPPNPDNAVLFGCDSSGAELSSQHSHGGHEKMASSMPLPVFFEFVNAQHITMYAAFIIGSVIELLVHARVGFIPAKLELVSGVLAFTIEGFLFAFHLHSRAPLDIRLHVLLTYAIFGCAIMNAMEIAWPKQVLFTYGRILFTGLQGTWFCHVGLILYPPFDSPAFLWDRCDHEQVMTVTMLFCWHLLLIFIGLIIQLWLIDAVYRSSRRIRERWSELSEIDAENRSELVDVTPYSKCPYDEDEELNPKRLDLDESV